MDLASKLVAAGLLVLVVGPAQVGVTVRRMADARRDLLTHLVGRNLTLVPAAAQPVEGMVRCVSRRAVQVRTAGAEVAVPLEDVREVWEGRRLLARL